ncbi:MAG: c-type cytochrome [Deltaproteobacteria bacterium]|nr:c-type cytochrome [Deltaproteobacteria bacterium]
MRALLHELFAATLVTVSLVGISAAMQPEPATRGMRVVSLTGVKKDGVFTDEKVDGTNYWRRSFRRATVVLDEGETILLRLQSADVTHGFYVPELGVGPVLIEPGKVVELELQGKRAGLFTYYCTAVCGHCHYYMQGTIRVLGRGRKDTETAAAVAPGCRHGGERPASTPRAVVDHGQLLFASMGCESCHGPRGSGGVRNYNYVKDVVPQNNLLAERLQLFEPDDAETVLALIDKGADLAALETTPPFKTYSRFLAQYKAVQDLIKNGNRAGKKDPAGPAPPLSMPAWREQLTDRDIESLIAFLLAQFPWDE